MFVLSSNILFILWHRGMQQLACFKGIKEKRHRWWVLLL